MFLRQAKLMPQLKGYKVSSISAISAYECKTSLKKEGFTYMIMSEVWAYRRADTHTWLHSQQFPSSNSIPWRNMKQWAIRPIQRLYRKAKARTVKNLKLSLASKKKTKEMTWEIHCREEHEELKQKNEREVWREHPLCCLLPLEQEDPKWRKPGERIWEADCLEWSPGRLKFIQIQEARLVANGMWLFQWFQWNVREAFIICSLNKAVYILSFILDAFLHRSKCLLT